MLLRPINFTNHLPRQHDEWWMEYQYASSKHPVALLPLLILIVESDAVSDLPEHAISKLIA